MAAQGESQENEELSRRLLAGDERALARGITLLESGAGAGAELLRNVRANTGRARIVGVTGAPGCGKSTLVDAIIATARAGGRRVAVVAVDPSSPFSGGAILGDRIRMTRWHDDVNVFIRSMASRGHLGGLAATTLQIVALLDAAGFELVLIETVGVGQSEIEVVQAADTTVLVLSPGMGDGVQAFKAGIMEVADVFCVNKADLPGADRLRQEIRSAMDLAPTAVGAWRPPIVATVATGATGVDDLLARVDGHQRHLADRGVLADNRRRRVRAEVMAVLADSLRRSVVELDEGAIDAILAGRATPRDVAGDVLGRTLG